MKKQFKLFLILPIFLIGFALFAKAQNIFDIQFPIAELGNCASMQECKAYCDDKNNTQACVSWAEAKGFKKPAPPSPQRAGQAPVRQQAVSVLAEKSGPGGCRDGEECNAFCSKSENREECFKFAKEHNLISQEEIERVEERMQPKEGPGGCKSFQECDAFCRNPDNAKTCIEFSVKEGKITQEDADFLIKRAQERKGPPQGQPLRGPKPPQPKKPEGPQIDEIKAKQILDERGGPGGCNSMEACEQFCSTQGNEEICMNFAAEHGLMPKEDVEKFKKVMSATGPGGCRGRACEQYCENPEHGEECLNFATENGFMDKEEAEEAKKFMKLAKAGGPGGCRGQRECDAFCSNPENREECFNFAKNNNLIPQEEIEKMEKEREIITKLESAGGPGGCKGPKECFEYCSNPEHMQECFEFGSKQGMIPQENMQRIEELRQGMPMDSTREFPHERFEGGFEERPNMMPISPQQGFVETPDFRKNQETIPMPPRRQNMPEDDRDLLRGDGHPQPIMIPKEGIYQQNPSPMPIPPEFERKDWDIEDIPPMGMPSQFPDSQYQQDHFQFNTNMPYPNMPRDGYNMPPQDGNGIMPMNTQGGTFMPPQTMPAPAPAPEPYQQPQSKVFKLLLSNPIIMLINLLR